MNSLFGSGISQGDDGSNGVIKIKAGRCELTTLDSGKIKVTPKPERGWLELKSDTGEYTTLMWRNRETEQLSPSDELILMPNSIKLVRVQTPKETDRVYRVKWTNGGNNIMFWLQDKNASRDEILIQRFNDKVANPRAGESPSPRGGLRPSPYGGFPLVPSNPRMGTENAVVPPAAPTLDFNQFLSTYNANRADAPPPAPTSAAATTRPSRLQDTITAERVLASGILEDSAVRAALVQLLPEGQQDDASLEANLRSPQLYDAMRVLTSALTSENYNSVFANLGLDPAAGNDYLLRGDVVRAFLQAMQTRYPAENSGDTNGSSEGDSKMEE